MNPLFIHLVPLFMNLICVQSGWAEEKVADITAWNFVADENDLRKEIEALKKAAEQSAKEFEVLRSNLRAWKEIAASVKKEAKAEKTKSSNLEKELEALKIAAKQSAMELENLRKQFQLQLIAAELNNERDRAEIARLKVQLDGLSKTLQRSEQDKVMLRDRVNKLQNEAKPVGPPEKKNDGGTKETVKNPNEPNPPPVKVNGRVLKVSQIDTDGAGVLIQVSVGADQGVNEYHTLDVYRTTPMREYLGRIRIISVTERESVGRLVDRGAPNSSFRAGDLVTDNFEKAAAPPKK